MLTGTLGRFFITTTSPDSPAKIRLAIIIIRKVSTLSFEVVGSSIGGGVSSGIKDKGLGWFGIVKGETSLSLT